MSKNKKKTEQETESELYYEMNVEKLIIHNEGGTVIFQSGQPTPPVKPPGGGGQ